MKHLFCTLLCLVGFWSIGQAQFADEVNVLDIKVGATKTVKGDLSSGTFKDLRFGNSVGCFSDAEKSFFNGNHVIYGFKVPANTKVLVEINAADHTSLYGYMLDASTYTIPPYLEKVSKSGCSASHNGAGAVDRIMMKAGSTPMNVVVGVTGVNEAAGGSFTLKVVTRQ
ncbi:MAG: hypothetical protein GY810_26765 [Aureispira sp.]|nr:hypothetical protein [Aureispira sp.]